MRAARALICVLFWAFPAPLPAQPLPPRLEIAGLSVAEHQHLLQAIARTARRAQVSEAALTAVAQRIGELQGESVDLAALLAALDRQADRVRALETRLSLLEGGDAETTQLRMQAAVALEQGRLSAAEALLLSVAERELASAESALQNAAASLAAAAETAELQFAYSRSAQLWRRAAELTQSDGERWRYRFAEATAMSRPDAPCDDDMCREQVEPSGAISISLGPGTDALRQSIDILERQARPLAPRARFAQWVETETAIARRYGRLCQRGGEGERTSAECLASLETFVVLLGALPDADPRARDVRWRIQALLETFRIAADAQIKARADAALASVIPAADAADDRLLMGMAHVLRGDIAIRSGEDEVSQRRAIDAHRRGVAALLTVTGPFETYARNRAAAAQNRVGRYLMGLAHQRSDTALWRGAGSFFEQTLSLNLAGDDTNRAFAAYQLATILLFLHERGEPFQFERARQLFASALDVYRRDIDPEIWAVIENNLGRAYEFRGNELRARGDAASFQASIEAYNAAAQHYRRALEVWTPSHANYNVAQQNLFRVLGRNVVAAPAPERMPAPNDAPERGGRPGN